MEFKTKANMGITLISLVITIIVLIILAGVTISSISRNNGIINKAEQAKKNVQVSSVIEKIQVDVLKKYNSQKGKFTESDFENILINYGSLSGGPELISKILKTKEKNEIPVKDILDLLDIKFYVDKKPDVQKPTPGKPTPDGIFTETSTVDGNTPTENNPIIPEGFKPMDINPTPTPDTVNKGFVITDGQAEFVWVPVPDITKMVGGTEKQNNPGERWGKLYSKTNIDNPENGTDIAKPTNTSYREPDVLTATSNADGNQAYLDIMNNILGTSYNINTFKTELEKDFYKMSESVKKYKGFYVGRYESSLVGSDNNAYLAPIKGAMSANAAGSLSSSWYGLYARQKKYKKGQIEGSMIWGCQYDAMMKWMKKNRVNVESLTPLPEASKNTGRTTGTVETDKLCNVYDLLGNSYEWTLEAHNTYFRVNRGGNYEYGVSPANRFDDFPNDTNLDNSIRAALYIP